MTFIRLVRLPSLKHMDMMSLGEWDIFMRTRRFCHLEDDVLI